MFEEVREHYQMTGAGDEFFRMLKKEAGSFEEYISEKYLRDVNTEWLGLESTALEALIDAARKLKKHPELLMLASSIRDRIFDNTLSVDYLVHLGFPKPHSGDQEMDAFFGLLIHLSGIQTVKERYEHKKIPLSVMRDSYRSVRIWVDSFKTFYGYYGHDRECPRMLYIENFRFIRIGRLEFEPDYFYGQAVVLKKRSTGELCLFATGGTLYRTDGKIDGTNEIYDPYSKTAFYKEDADSITGHEITGGRIQDRLRPLSKQEWDVVLRPGDVCINSHIPRDGKLSVTEAEESFEKAREFFRTYFPEMSADFFQCHSWMLDDAYESMLGQDSNIVRFQKLFTRFPEKSGDFGAMISVFTEAPFVLADWTPTTTLQSKLKEYCVSGGTVSNFAGIREVSGGKK